MCINRLVKLNPVNFDEEVLCSDIPVLVGFCAPWSKAEMEVETLLSRISVLEVGRVKVCKFNVDEDPMFALRRGVRDIPTVMLFKRGRLVDLSVCLRPEAQGVSLHHQRAKQKGICSY